MAYRPRKLRDLERARHAAAVVRLQGQSAIAAALTQIGVAFDEAAACNAFKLRVERLLGLGPQHPAVWARYRARAEMLTGRSLTEAIAVTERWWRDERRAFQIANALGRGNAHSLEVLRELRLILRLMRRRRMAAAFDTVVAAVRGEPMPLAAE